MTENGTDHKGEDNNFNDFNKGEKSNKVLYFPPQTLCTAHVLSLVDLHCLGRGVWTIENRMLYYKLFSQKILLRL